MTIHSHRKINLLFILQTFRTGGSERIVLDLCENLDPAKFKCFVVALVGGELEKTFREKGVITHCVYKRGHDALRVMRQISTFIKKHQIHVINAHHFTPFLHSFYGAKIHGCKIFYTGHTSPEIDLLNGFWSMVGKILLHFSDGAIAISDGVYKSIIKKFHLKKDKAFKIINAVNHKRFEIDVDTKKKKKELNIQSKEKVIGSVGSLRKQKNYPNLIRAFNIVQKKMGNVKLLIIGEGKRRSELKALVKELGLDSNVLFLGARLDVPELMNIMDIYCLASFFEGLPLTLLEAMSAGLPVIGTDVTGITDVIIHESTGLLVQSDDPEALAKSLVRLLTNPALAKELSVNGKRYVFEKHGMAKWISEYEQLFI